MAVLYTNNAVSALSASITNAATSFSITSGHGVKFPVTSASDYFYVTLYDSAGNIEIVKVTARATDTFTVTRAQDGTTALAFSAADKVELRVTKAVLDDIKTDTKDSLTSGNVTTALGFTPYNATNPNGYITSSGLIPIANGGTNRSVGNYSIYANEIHVGKDGNDTTGDGTLINPVLTITKALTLVGAGRNTVIVHPGSYSESPTVSSANTTIATSELTGANTQISGTLTLSAAARISGIKLTNLTITGSGNIYISNCTVDTQVVKSGTNYVEIINSELQCVSGIQISGSGVVSIIGNKCWAVAVSNASASVLIKDSYQVITPSVTAGTLQLDGSAIFAASPASNAVTSSAGSFITLANCFVLNSAGTNVERVSLAGFYSILNLVYDKTNSTFAGTSLNAIDYFQYINADRVNFNGSTSGITGLIASAVAGTTSLTLPAATDTLVGRATTDTLTNKRIQPRVLSAASATTFAVNADSYDVAEMTMTGVAGTLAIGNPTGTPVNGQKLIYKLQTTNAQTYNWGTIFQGSTDLALPTASSGTSKWDYYGFIYNSTATKWQLIAKMAGF